MVGQITTLLAPRPRCKMRVGRAGLGRSNPKDEGSRHCTSRPIPARPSCSPQVWATTAAGHNTSRRTTYRRHQRQVARRRRVGRPSTSPGSAKPNYAVGTVGLHRIGVGGPMISLTSSRSRARSRHARALGGDDRFAGSSTIEAQAATGSSMPPRHSFQQPQRTSGYFTLLASRCTRNRTRRAHQPRGSWLGQFGTGARIVYGLLRLHSAPLT